MTASFSRKLDDLNATLLQLGTFDVDPIAERLLEGSGHSAIAVGSGGSAVGAEFLAYCRETLGFGITVVQTPMEMVLGTADLCDVDVWLFSASANNADVLAAARAATQRGCRTIQIVTRSAFGEAAVYVQENAGTVLSVPVASESDGYLATHSMISTLGCLLLASDAIVGDPLGRREIVCKLQERLEYTRSPTSRLRFAEAFSELSSRKTLILLADPQFRSVSTLLETSLWEASICTVQCADFRNFAHGRHTWLHHHATSSFVLALTSHETKTAWAALSDLLPPPIRRETIHLGECGRLFNVLGVIEGLGVIEAMGMATNIDPGKPGYGKFGPAIYDDRSLEDVEAELPKTVRHKRIARRKFDEPVENATSLISAFNQRLDSLGSIPIGALAFDYDGTLVATSKRLDPPCSEIVAELIRLDAHGIRLGVATGRGKSAGEDLRKVLPQDMHKRVILGYYNGSHLTTLDVDISQDRLLDDPAVVETAAWLRERGDLFKSTDYKVKPTQITIDADKLEHPYRFRRVLLECPAVQSRTVRITQSGHSFDIVASSTSKLAVVEALAHSIPDKQVLCFGDSGAAAGNDYALLASPYGISVGEVCGSTTGCWSLFGRDPTGPDALLKVLRALIPSSQRGEIRLSIDALLSNATDKNNA